MQYHYTRDPDRIRQQSYAKIRTLANLERFTPEQQQVVIHMIRAYGDPDLAQYIHFTDNAIEVGLKAVKHQYNILYDIDMVAHTLDKRRLYQEPLSFLHRAQVISQAKLNKQTRTGTAVEFWKPYMRNSLVLFGQSGTALFRFLELLQEGAPRPSLVIAAARGFVNADNAKQALWAHKADYGLECIMVEGSRGGGVLAGTAMNALMWMHANIYI
jgi:precorrin-8X/cobalt-precorrin-8 methylmutase